MNAATSSSDTTGTAWPLNRMPRKSMAAVDVTIAEPSSSSWCTDGVATDGSGDQCTGGFAIVVGDVGRTMSMDGILAVFVLLGGGCPVCVSARGPLRVDGVGGSPAFVYEARGSFKRMYAVGKQAALRKPRVCRNASTSQKRCQTKGGI